MEVREIKKLYYSISEVSEITGLKQYVLRYWETEFSQLKPNKNRSGNRTYKSHDVDLILKIKSLLYDRKFTIKGAQQYLKISRKEMKKYDIEPKIIKISKTYDAASLHRIKDGLEDLIDLIESYKD